MSSGNTHSMSRRRPEKWRKKRGRGADVFDFAALVNFAVKKTFSVPPALPAKKACVRDNRTSEGRLGGAADEAGRYFVAPGQAGELIAFLAAARGESRRAAKRLLDERRVFVNGRRVWMARHALRAGDTVEIQTPPPRYAPDAPISILAEQGPFLIVNKPAGALSNEGAGSVEARLRASLGEPELTAVHRLDRETSGCLLLARTRADADRLIPLFRARRVRKIYWALVFGRFPDDIREIRRPLDGEEAVSFVRVLDAASDASLLEVRIETGRTHQIRRHLLEAGYPLAGDRAYGNSRARDARARALPRQMLHALRLALRDAETGLAIEALAPPPEDFLAALRAYGLRPPTAGRPPRPPAERS